MSQVSSLRMKKLATSVGCPAFINSHPQKDFRTEALWFFCGAVVHPLKSLNSDQFWCFLHCSIQLPGYSQDLPWLQDPATGLLPRVALPLAPPCGSAVLAGKAWLLPGLPGRQSGAKVSEPAVCSGRCPQPPTPTWLQWPWLVRERALWSREKHSPRTGRPCQGLALPL